MDVRKLVVIILTIFILSAFSPFVVAVTEDNLIITFDPDGDIDIDINLASYNLSSSVAGTWTNTTGGTFTLYNNGTVPMDTQIKTNTTTDTADMSLNASGVPPAQDEYAIYIKDLDIANFLTDAYALEFDQGLNPNDSNTFDICLLLGNLSANHSLQTTTISFQGSIS